MKNDNFKEIGKIFRSYKDNKKKLETDYKIPVPSGVRYDKISVKKDPSINSVEKMTVEYIAERERLFKEVFIVDEVLNYFKLEGHGRERFIYSFLINRCSWVKAEIDCHVSRTTLCYWRRDVFEKATTVASWINYF